MVYVNPYVTENPFAANNFAKLVTRRSIPDHPLKLGIRVIGPEGPAVVVEEPYMYNPDGCEPKVGIRYDKMGTRPFPPWPENVKDVRIDARDRSRSRSPRRGGRESANQGRRKYERKISRRGKSKRINGYTKKSSKKRSSSRTRRTKSRRTRPRSYGAR